MATNPVAEEQYDFQRLLGKIRKSAMQKKGNKATADILTDDNFRRVMFGSLLPGKKYRRTDGDIREAVNIWCIDRTEAIKRYGHISDWDVSSVTNMSELFRNQKTFNDDISKWNVSNVTDMKGMFLDASAFNQPIGDWDVSNVTSMFAMFYDAFEFDQDLTKWDVAHVINYQSVFLDCGISDENKPKKFRLGSGGAVKKTRRARMRASRKRSQKGRRSRKGLRTLKRGTRRTRRR
jgi:surface protein